MDKTYQYLKTALDTVSYAQEVTMQNISNVNTKEYHAKTVDFKSQLSDLMKYDNATYTDEQRVEEIKNFKAKTEFRRNDLKKDENDVDLNEEMIELSETQLIHDGLINSINRKIELRNLVIKGDR